MNDALYENSYPNRGRRIRLLIVSNYCLISESLQQMVETNRDMQVVERLDEERLKTEKLAPDAADVAVVYLHDHEPVKIIGELQERIPGIRVVAVVNGEDLEMQTEALQLGAAGIVRREQNHKLLFDAIRQTFKGEVWLNQTLLSKILNNNKAPKKASRGRKDGLSVESLTAREIEVISMIGNGLKNKTIADRLCISEATVRHHLSSIYGKLEVEDRLNLVILAYQNGLIQIGRNSSEPI